MSKVMWGWLKERSIDQYAADGLIDVAAFTAVTLPSDEIMRLSMPYMRVDAARNAAVSAFLETCQDPDDVLVMLDSDHLHPPSIICGLVRHVHDIGVVGALAFRRDETSTPLFFMVTDGVLRAPAEWVPNTLYSCDFVGSGAIAIKRWVFDQLKAAGEHLPYWRITYADDDATGSIGEDRYFAELCIKHGIKHHCDTSLEIPHIGMRLSTSESWKTWKQRNAEQLRQSIYRPDVPRSKPTFVMPRIVTRVKAD